MDAKNKLLEVMQGQIDIVKAMQRRLSTMSDHDLMLYQYQLGVLGGIVLAVEAIDGCSDLQAIQAAAILWQRQLQAESGGVDGL